LAVRLSVLATPRSSGRSQGLFDHFGNRRLRQIASTPGSLHDGVQLLIGEPPDSLIDGLQTRARREEDRQYLLSKLLPLILGEG